VSLVQNLAPLLVALTSYVLYKQALTRLDTSVLLVSFLGVIMLITGGAKKENIDEEQLTNVALMILPTILFLLMPINECSI
jgi:drug/metabolite transporter (DMT)-like permease